MFLVVKVLNFELADSHVNIWKMWRTTPCDVRHLKVTYDTWRFWAFYTRSTRVKRGTRHYLELKGECFPS